VILFCRFLLNDSVLCHCETILGQNPVACTAVVSGKIAAFCESLRVDLLDESRLRLQYKKARRRRGIPRPKVSPSARDKVEEPCEVVLVEPSMNCIVTSPDDVVSLNTMSTPTAPPPVENLPLMIHWSELYRGLVTLLSAIDKQITLGLSI